MPRSRGRPPHDDQLTPAEWDVVEGVRHGLSNGQIAQRRGVGLDSVKFHVGNALANLALADRQALRRWDGVRRESRLNRRLIMETPALGSIGQVARTVADLEAAKAFYGGTLGLPHLFTFGELAFFDCGGTRLYLHQTEVRPESCLYFEVGDIHSVHRDLEAKGVVFQSAPHMIHRHADGTEEWMAFFNDPEGRVLALMARG